MSTSHRAVGREPKQVFSMQSKGPPVHAPHCTLSSIQARILGHPYHALLSPQPSSCAEVTDLVLRSQEHTLIPGSSRSLSGMDVVLTLHSFTHSSTSFVYPTLFYAQSPYGV